MKINPFPGLTDKELISVSEHHYDFYVSPVWLHSHIADMT